MRELVPSSVCVYLCLSIGYAFVGQLAIDLSVNDHKKKHLPQLQVVPENTGSCVVAPPAPLLTVVTVDRQVSMAPDGTCRV